MSAAQSRSFISESSVPGPVQVLTQPNRRSISSGSRFSVGVPMASPISPAIRQAYARPSKSSIVVSSLDPSGENASGDDGSRLGNGSSRGWARRGEGGRARSSRLDAQHWHAYAIGQALAMERLWD